MRNDSCPCQPSRACGPTIGKRSLPGERRRSCFPDASSANYTGRESQTRLFLTEPSRRAQGPTASGPYRQHSSPKRSRLIDSTRQTTSLRKGGSRWEATYSCSSRSSSTARTEKGLFEPGHTFVYDAFPLEIDRYGASAWTAQALSALRRGAAVFRVVQLERCSICGLVFARNPGDTWAFTIIGDRLPIAVMIVLIYFGVVRSRHVLGLTMLVVLAALVIWTAPNRWGAGIALHYLSRVYWPDPADSIPPPPAPRPRS